MGCPRLPNSEQVGQPEIASCPFQGLMPPGNSPGLQGREKETPSTGWWWGWSQDFAFQAKC